MEQTSKNKAQFVFNLYLKSSWLVLFIRNHLCLFTYNLIQLRRKKTIFSILSSGVVVMVILPACDQSLLVSIMNPNHQSLLALRTRSHFDLVSYAGKTVTLQG